MKLRNFIKNNKDKVDNLGTAFEEVANEFKPVTDKISKPVKGFLKNRPKQAFFIMIGILIINIGFVIYYNHTHPDESPVFDFTSLKFSDTTGEKYQQRSISMPDIAVSFGNIQKARVLKDTLEYLMQLKHMTYQDTLTFVRVVEEFNAITGGTDKQIMPITVDSLRKMKSQRNPLQEQQGAK